MDWLLDRGAAELFLLGVAAFFALALLAGLLTAIGKATGAFKRGWDSAGPKGD